MFTGLSTAALTWCALMAAGAAIAAVVAFRSAERVVHLGDELRLARTTVNAAVQQLKIAHGKVDDLDVKVASLRGLVYRGRRRDDGTTPPEVPDDDNAPPAVSGEASDDFSAMLRLQSAPAPGPGG